MYAKVFIFYSQSKMISERSKRRDLLACIFITNNNNNNNNKSGASES